MTEDDLKAAVIEMARLFGAVVAHFRPARAQRADGTQRWITPVEADGKGYPDLTIACAGRVIFRELKSATGHATAEQKMWMLVLPDCKIWRPADLRSGLIESELRELTAPQTGTATRPQPARMTPQVRPQPPAWLRADPRRRP